MNIDIIETITDAIWILELNAVHGRGVSGERGMAYIEKHDIMKEYEYCKDNYPIHDIHVMERVIRSHVRKRLIRLLGGDTEDFGDGGYDY